MVAKSKASSAPALPSVFPQLRRLPASDESRKVLIDPVQVTNDFQIDCWEKSQKMTVLASLATIASNFIEDGSPNNINTLTISWAIPHLLRSSETQLLDDPRGSIVMLKETMVTFRNVLSSEIVLHVNTPFAMLNEPTLVYARASGMKGAKKGNRKVLTDDIHIKAGETIRFNIPWDKMKGTQPMTIVGGSTQLTKRLYMNCCTFVIEIKNVNPSTGEAYDEESECCDIICSQRYWKRKSNPIVALNEQCDMQGTENFGIAKLEGGITDLYMVDPVDAQASVAGGMDGRYVRDAVMFSTRPGRVIHCQDAVAEGIHFGVAGLSITDLKITTAALKVQKADATYDWLKLPSRQSSAVRLMIPGLNVASDDRDPSFSMSYFKWMLDAVSGGAWVLWDEEAKAPRHADPKLGIETIISTFVPIMVIDGVASPKGFYSLPGLKNEYGQPYGSPKNFASFLQTCIGVVNEIDRVANFVGGFL